MVKNVKNLCRIQYKHNYPRMSKNLGNTYLENYISALESHS